MRHDPIDSALFTEHRKLLAAKLPPKSVAIVHAADPLATNGDGVVRYVPAADLFWLTGIEQLESVVVLIPDSVNPADREMLFIREPNASLETWEGHSLTKEEAQAISGIRTVFWSDNLASTLHPLLVEKDSIVLNTNEHSRAGLGIESRDLRMAHQFLNRYPLHSFQRLAPTLRELRAVKSTAEVDIIRDAIAITKHGLDNVLSHLKPGAKEYELEAELIGEFTRRRATMGYEPIVASGKNACTLHYIDNNGSCQDGDLLLIDVGANHANYTADVTRVFPVSGRFTPRQKELYQAVLRVLQSSIKRTVIGATLSQWKWDAQHQMAEELLELGLIDKNQYASDSMENPACKNFFMHGLGHSLGLGVHDPAPSNGPLESGWVMTVEPGLYLPSEGIEIRLENDVLVTESGPVDLCQDIPLEPDDIEDWIASSQSS
jgi:Xaa-Pro aminopeptidase